MGVLRFHFDPPGLADHWPEAHRAYVSGFDGRIYPTRIEVGQGVLTCRRNASESGKLNVAWPVQGFGRPVLTTASLMEREEPYLLTVELARGKICQLRDQISAWQISGMMMPEDLAPLLRSAHEFFAHAAALQSDRVASEKLAEKSLVKACEAAESLTRSYVRQRLHARRRKAPGLPTLLACGLGPEPAAESWSTDFPAAFNAAVIPIEWSAIEPEEGTYLWDTLDSQVEWCRDHKLMTIGGPLLDFAAGGLPQWLWKWENDFFNLQSFFSDFVETALSRYFGQIRHWEVAARANTGGGLALSEEHRLMLVARVLEIARQIDDEIQLMVRVDQPWGEYQARGQHQLSPLQFVDAIMRSGVGLSAVNLEIGVGYRPRGSASRDVLDFSRLIDQWSTLGIPLNIVLACPSSAEHDPASHSDLEVDAPAWKREWSEEMQAEWTELYLPLMMAKQSVGGIVWTHFSDGSRHYFPNAGLVRADGTPKAVLHRIAQFRREFWKPGE